MVESSILEMLLTKETVFFALFLYLFYVQQTEKKQQSSFLQKQQTILSELTASFEKLAHNQEKLTERIERIEIHLEKDGSK